MSEFLQLVPNRVGNVIVIRIRDQKMTNQVGLRQSGLELNQLIEREQHLKILVDLGYVDSISSGVLLKLVGLKSQVRGRDGVFQMCGVGPKTLAVLAVAKLTKCFEIRNDKEHALATFERADDVWPGQNPRRKRRIWQMLLSRVFSRNHRQSDYCRTAASSAL